MKIKKVTLAIIASVGILAAGSFLLTSQYIAEANAKLSVEEAKAIAFKTANVNAKDVKQYTVKLEKENGITVYDVEFYVNNIAYDYEIDANTGVIISSDSEVEYLVIKPDTTKTQQTNTNTNYIGVAKAKSIATKDAGVNANQAKFYTSKLDYEDGRAVYDIEFYVGNVEYDYEIDAITGKILEKDMDIENFIIPQKNTNTNQNNSNNNYIGVAKAKSIATKDAGVNANQAKFYTSKLDYEDGRAVYDIEFYVGNVEYDYEIDAITGKILEKDMDIENFTIPQKSSQSNKPNASNNNSNNAYIGLEKAKSIALNHAGVSSARFTKAKVDTENGVRVYEIEFKVNGREYEYEIDAKTGAIRDFDIDD